MMIFFGFGFVCGRECGYGLHWGLSGFDYAILDEVLGQ